jgi:hypothetical protein
MIRNMEPVFRSRAFVKAAVATAFCCSPLAPYRCETLLAQEPTAPIPLAYAERIEPANRYELGHGLAPGFFLPPIPIVANPPTSLPSTVPSAIQSTTSAPNTTSSPNSTFPELVPGQLAGQLPRTNYGPHDGQHPTLAPETKSGSSGEIIIGSGVPQTWTPPNAPAISPEISPQPIAPSYAGLTDQPTTSYTPPIELDLRSSPPQVSNNTIGTSRPCAPLACPSPWFFSSNALLMQRHESRNTIFSSSFDNPSEARLTSRDVDFGTAGGFELGGGRYFGSGKYACMGSYWTLFSDPQTLIAPASSPNFSSALQSNLPFNVPSNHIPGVSEGITLNGTPVQELFANASAHRLVRDQDIQNMEINLYWFAIGGSARQPLAPNCTDSDCWNISKQPTGSNAPWFQVPTKLRVSLFSGVRWFQFRDALSYSADDVDYNIDARNDLWGVQSGAITHWLASPRWSFFSSLSGGVYNNHLQSASRVGDSLSDAQILASGPANAQAYRFEGSDNASAFLGEAATGLAWHFARGWTANASYRVLGASQIATSLGQIPSDFRVPAASNPQNDESLMLHGVSLGMTYNF